MNLDLFTCNEKLSIIEALKKIDKNKCGFLIVIDDNKRVIATLSDGDIRRSLIKGISVNDSISKSYNTSFISIKSSNPINAVIDIFKNESIKFIPITNDNDELVNIITKSQLHSLLLQDIPADLNYDFYSLDTNIINSEIYGRPWGFYKTTVLNNYYQSKVISINPCEQLSLQSHKHRDEYWIVTHGNGIVTIDNETKDVKPGDMLTILKNSKHMLKNLSNIESLIITEVQLGDYFGEDDIIRYEDKYGRK